MASTFNGFSEEDIQRLKSKQHSGARIATPANVKKIDKIGAKPHKPIQQFKTVELSDDLLEQALGELDVSFDKCKLSLKSPQDITNNNEPSKNVIGVNDSISNEISEDYLKPNEGFEVNSNSSEPNKETSGLNNESYQSSSEAANSISYCNKTVTTPDVVSSSDGNYNEERTMAQTAKLEEMQVKQKLMEEQNRRRKEMLAKALADRTKQTEEETLRLERIKRELAVLDGQLSQDVAILRKKIDLSCLTYADAEKQYLRIEKEFLQAKLNLQKEKEKKELLTEHLYALITHNETRKAQKLVTLMEQLASTGELYDNVASDTAASEMSNVKSFDESSGAMVVDGVDERTGKMVEINDNFS